MREIHFEIENKCILNCKHCSSVIIREEQKRKFEFEDIKNLLNKIPEVETVFLTGGEPILSNDFMNILTSIHLHFPKIKIGVFTSGILKNQNKVSCINTELAEQIKLGGISMAYFSIYHIEGKLHDKITGYNGSLKLTIDSLRSFIAVGIETKVHLVLNKHNFHDIEKTIEYLSRIGVSEVRILRLARHGDAAKNWDNIGISYEEQDEVIKDIFKRRETCSVNITIAGFPELMGCRPFQNANGCEAGTELYYVGYNGDIYPCACTRNNSNCRIGIITSIDNMYDWHHLSEFQIDNKICLNSISNSL